MHDNVRPVCSCVYPIRLYNMLDTNQILRHMDAIACLGAYIICGNRESQEGKSPVKCNSARMGGVCGECEFHILSKIRDVSSTILVITDGS